MTETIDARLEAVKARLAALPQNGPLEMEARIGIAWLHSRRACAACEQGDLMQAELHLTQIEHELAEAERLAKELGT